MRAHAQPRDFLHLEPDVRVDHVVGEDAAFLEEAAVLVERLKRHVERVADRRDVLGFLGLEVVEILVRRVARDGSCCGCRRYPPSASPAKHRYGFAVESGNRTSMRRAFGFMTCGIRIDAERLRAEYASMTGASKPGTRRL